MSSTLPVSSLLAGACLNANTESGYKCAYQPSDCSVPSEHFVSPLWLDQNHPQWASRCGSQPEVRVIPGLGRCQSEVEDYLCTSDRSACALPRSFERPADDCNLLQDAFAGTNYDNPQFGRCAHSRNPGRDFCAWSKADCQHPDATANEEFTFQVADPSMGHVSHTSCGCHNVHVGACVFESDNPMDSVWYCAVSEEVCASTPGEEDFRYYPVLEFQAYSNKSCRLCDGTIVDLPPLVQVPEPTASPVIVAEPKPPTPQSLSTGSSSASSSSSSASSSSSSKTTRKNNQNNVGLVTGFVVGGLVVVAIMTFVVVVSTKRRAAGAPPRSPHTGAAQLQQQEQEEEETISENTTTTNDDIEAEELPEDEECTLYEY